MQHIGYVKDKGYIFEFDKKTNKYLKDNFIIVIPVLVEKCNR